VARRPVSCRIAARMSRSELVGATNDDGVVINISPVFLFYPQPTFYHFISKLGMKIVLWSYFLLCILVKVNISILWRVCSE